MNLYSTHSKRGFTLIEILVVIVIIVLLLSFLVPAVQSIRDTARKAQCANNMRQIGVGLQNFYSIHNMFVPVHMLKFGTNTSNDYSSPHAHLLPFLEQTNLFDSLNYDILTLESPSAPSLENHTARNTKVATFICPSDSEPEHLNSYRFNGGRFDSEQPGLPYDGPFNIGFLPSQANITNGLSYTAFLSERIAGTFDGGSKNINRDIKSTQKTGIITSDSQYIAICLKDQKGNWYQFAGRYWFYAGFTNTLYNHNAPPNDFRPTCSVVGANDAGAGGLSHAKSYHNASVNVMYGDSHVSSVRNSIDPVIWQKQGKYR